MASPEVVPFVKTGGLADVCGALPKALARLGHEVKVILPFYKAIDRSKFGIRPTTAYGGIRSIWIGKKCYDLQIHSCQDKDAGVEFIFIGSRELFDREGIYLNPVDNKDFPDNDERYIFFAMATLEAAKGLDFRPEIIHAHDWQAGLIPGYLRTLYSQDIFFAETHSIFTIHNIGYQGHFNKATFPKLGLPEYFFRPGSAFEYWDCVNFLKIGIMTADIITTVSPTYAREIQASNEMGFGMEGILTSRAADIFGVLNGVDYDDWSPEKDRLIPHNYSERDLSGKARNKAALLKTAGFEPKKSNPPLIGIISRLADQKGFDLLAAIAEQLFALDLQLILLGTGEAKYHSLFEALEKKYPQKLRVFLKFDNKLAHLIEAGADMFLMPSRYEPCGLNQMYSLKYGTVPIVRSTGGLADTIIDQTTNSKKGTGFVFKPYEPQALLDAIKRALASYRRKESWRKIQLRGMAADFSWDNSAKKYVEIYQHAHRRQQAVDMAFHQL